MDRLTQLLAFYEEDPNEPFNIYALAMEYYRNNPSKALIYLELLVNKFPDYIATYYQLAHLYIDLDETQKADLVFNEGIKQCKIQNKKHALGELERAYKNFLFEN